MSTPNRAEKIEITWDDGMHHEWTPGPDGRWKLNITEPNGPTLPTITGYDAPNICRVITAAVNSNASPTIKE